jgi:hypothetical protein
MTPFDGRERALEEARAKARRDHAGLRACCFDLGYQAGLAAREERNPDGKIQMYNLDGKYPDLPLRLLEWPDFCTEVDRANAAEARIVELEAAARGDTERPEGRLRHVTERLILAVERRHRPDGTDELDCAKEAARAALRDTEQEPK